MEPKFDLRSEERRKSRLMNKIRTRASIPVCLGMGIGYWVLGIGIGCRYVGYSHTGRKCAYRYECEENYFTV